VHSYMHMCKACQCTQTDMHAHMHISHPCTYILALVQVIRIYISRIYAENLYSKNDFTEKLYVQNKTRIRVGLGFRVTIRFSWSLQSRISSCKATRCKFFGIKTRNPCTHTHVHKHTHTHAYMYIHASTHTHECIYIHIRACTYVHTIGHTHIQTSMHTDIPNHSNTCTYRN